MPWQKYKNCMVSYSTLPWSFLPDANNLPTLKPCSQVSIIVLLCHTPHPAAPLKTLSCGQDTSNPLLSQETSTIQYPSWNTYSNASSGFGIGIMIGDKWYAWCLLPGWKANGCDIGYAKAIGFKLLIGLRTARITGMAVSFTPVKCFWSRQPSRFS